MYRMIAIATSVGVALGIAGAFAAADSKPTDPQIAHIAYTAGVLDVEAGKQALDKSRMKMSAPSLSGWLGTIPPLMTRRSLW